MIFVLAAGELPSRAATRTTKQTKQTKTPKSAKPTKASKREKATVQKFPDVVSVELVQRATNIFDVTVTLSSPYDTRTRYADAWRVLDEQATVLGVREILHDHATEQPFTRSLEGITIPSTVKFLTVEGRDKTYGWGGTKKTVSVARQNVSVLISAALTDF
jgi:hypothetical protein